MKKLSFTVHCSLTASSEFGEIYIRLGSQTSGDADRFASFIQISRSIPIDTPGLVAAQLIAFDGVRPNQLLELSDAITSIRQYRRSVLLNWTDAEDDRIERRALSHMTQKTIAHQQKTRRERIDSGKKLQEELCELLGSVEGYDSLPRADRLLHLEADALAWWYFNVPVVLFGHLSGLQSFSAVPDSTLARQTTGKAISSEPKSCEDSAESIASSGRAYDMLDHLVRSNGEDKSTVVLSRILTSLTLKKTDTNPRAKRRWLVTLETFEEQVARAGPLTCLLTGWMLDMIEEGTIETLSPAASTIKKYFSSVAEPLLKALMDLPKNMNDWELEDLEQIYMGILQNSAATNQRSVAAALTNFHHFLVKHFDFSWLGAPLHPKFKSRVRANLVWPQEVDRALNWLDTVPDRRLAEPAALALCFGSTEPIRWSEFYRLRLHNVQFDGDVMSVEIKPSKKYGRLKSKSSQRTLEFHDKKLVERVRSWIALRRDEGAIGESLLFGDPRSENLIYRQHALHSLVNTVLKAATGDEQCTFHTLRHSIVSAKASAILNEGGHIGLDRWRQLAVRTGHSQTSMTLINYVHLYEIPLRRCLDIALAKIEVQSTQQGMIQSNGVRETNNTHSTVRLAGVLALIQRDSEGTTTFAPLADKYTFQDPVPPKFLAWKGATHCVEFTWWLLTRIVQGWGLEQVAHLYGMTPGAIRQLRDVAINVTNEVARRSFPRKYAKQIQRPSDLNTALKSASVDLDRALQAKHESISKWFKQPQDENVVLQACEAWLNCRHAEYLSLDEPTAISPLLKLCRLAGVQASAFRMCIPTAKDNNLKELVAWAETDFVTAFSVSPRMCTVTPRMGRPLCYLQFDHSVHGNSDKSAGGSTEGLDALLLSGLIHIKWNKKVAEGSSD